MFSKIVKTNIDSALYHHLVSLIVQRILFVELLFDQHLILFVYLNQLLLIDNGFLYNHNLINTLPCPAVNFPISSYRFISESIG